MSARIGIVVAVHPTDHSVDLVMADDGSRLVGVQVTTPNGSTRSGTVDLPEITPSGDKWDIRKPTGQDMKAIVSFVGTNPVVTGFLYPQVNQMLMKDGKARRYRHQSDVETLIDGDGNIQVTHPSGTYIRIGEAVAVDTLAGKHADTSSTDRNTAKQVSVHIAMAGGKATLTFAPDGSVSLVTKSTVNVKADGQVKIEAPSVLLDAAETKLTGNLEVLGTTTLKDVTSNAKDVGSTHTHLNSGGPGTGGIPS